MSEAISLSPRGFSGLISGDFSQTAYYTVYNFILESERCHRNGGSKSQEDPELEGPWT